MPMAAGNLLVPAAAAPMTVMPEAVARDAMLAWFRGEFAAANAIIDALCGHLALLGGDKEYKSVFDVVHRRRLNWIPVLQMQKYHSIAEITLELRRVAARIAAAEEDAASAAAEEKEIQVAVVEDSGGDDESGFVELNDEKVNSVENHKESNGDEDYDSPTSEITDTGSQDVQANCVSAAVEICDNHEDCEARQGQIKLTKGFSAKEPVKAHMVNVVKGLKLYEDVFTASELSKLGDFVNEIRGAGQNGELSGDTFILFNQQMKGNKRELIQLGVPIFGQIKDETTNTIQNSNIEPIPALLQNVIEHLIQWKLIPEYKRPNGCIITFFDEGEYSQPFLKPPHLEQPISTLLLSESTMAYGRILSSDSEGNYKGALMLSLKEGSLLVMRGNSSEMARHVMCPSPNRRVSLTFFRVRSEPTQCHSPTPQSTGAVTPWQPNLYATPNGGSYEASVDMMSKWGMVHGPVVMLAPVHPVVLSPRRAPPVGNGTGVYLPWASGHRKPHRHLPPRAQKGRLLALPPPTETRDKETNSKASNGVVAKSV